MNKLHYVKLEYVHHKDGNVLRTKEVYGMTSDLPTVGEIFLMVGQPLNETGNLRQVNTNVVTEVEGEDPIVFKTASGSTYRVHLKGKNE